MGKAALVSAQQPTGSGIHSSCRGSGPIVVVLHHSIQTVEWCDPWERLATDHEVWLVDIPGFGQSALPEWARSPRDLAILIGLWLDATDSAPVSMVGLGFGGWVAAELATLSPARLRHLVLVGSAGIRPTSREILDQFLISHVDYARAYFHDEARYVERFGEEPSMEQLVAWNDSREMTVRVSWKPHMYNRQLEALLPAIDVDATVVWGEHDAVMPIECGERLAKLLRAPFEVIPACGHAVDLEAPDDLERVVRAAVAAEAT